MNTPLVSIIIPVYRAESTLRKCLDSIVNQTFQEWEVVLVDDGSTDESGKICDDYVKLDSCFRVIHQTNRGVSAARQVGLEAVKGEYIIHADPDDWVEPTMLEELYNKAKMDDADMVICDYFADFGSDSNYRCQRPTSLESQAVLNELLVTLHGSCCNKLVKKSCVDRYDVKFPKGINYCEDVCFNVQLLKHNIKISYLNKAFYHYVQNQTSITNKYTIETLEIQKKYVAFLMLHLQTNSVPVLRSKEWVKKLAFRNNVLRDEELDNLYPEIKSSHSENLLIRLMYRFAFTGHHFIAKFLRGILIRSS